MMTWLEGIPTCSSSVYSNVVFDIKSPEHSLAESCAQLSNPHESPSISDYFSGCTNRRRREHKYIEPASFGVYNGTGDVKVLNHRHEPVYTSKCIMAPPLYFAMLLRGSSYTPI